VRAYEAVFIFDPELSEDSLNQLKDRIVSTINSNGSLEGINIWGRRKLAYPIHKRIEGIYYIFEFVGEAALPRELKRLTTITESIIRSMVVSREKSLKTEVSEVLEPEITNEPSEEKNIEEISSAESNGTANEVELESS